LTEYSKLKMQIAVSSIPAVQVISMLPILFKYMELEIHIVGAIFFCCRFAILLGSYSGGVFLRRVKVARIMLSAELINAAVLFLLMISIGYKSLSIIVVTLFLRCYLTGVINNARNSWLKVSKEQSHAEDVSVFSSIIVQISYVFGGLIYIFANQNIDVFKYVLVFDIITSLLGAIIIFNISSLNQKVEVLKNGILGLNFKESISFLTQRKFLKLGLVSFCLSVAVGGTDILCIKYGEKIFGEKIGFGVANIFYSVCFYLGYKITSKLRDNFTKVNLLTSFLLILGFILLGVSSSFSFMIFGVILVFTLYGVLYVSQDRLWYRAIDEKTATSGFAYKDFTMHLTVALGELVYGYFIYSEVYIRLTFSILLFFVLSIILLKVTKKGDT
jgi:predicted MFS family arabinose efflux permease